MSTHDHPPDAQRLPVVGNTPDWIRDACGFRERIAQQYDGDVVRYRLLDEDLHMVTDPEEIRRALVTDADEFEKTDTSAERIGFVLGEGLLTARGERWERQRRLIQPAFHPGRIKEYVEIMGDRTVDLADRWDPGRTVDVDDEMRELTLRILTEAIFGTEIGYRERGIPEAIEDVEDAFRPSNQPKMVATPDWLPIPTRKRAAAGLEHLDDVIHEMIDRRRAADGAGEDLLSTLLAAQDEDGEGMDDEQVRDELMTFFFAGHETTALSLTYTWYLLAKHPHVAEKLQAEVDEVLDGDPPTVADFGDLEYTESVIKESMRLYPPAHEMRRQAAKPVEVCGYSFPEGTKFTYPQWVMHRDGRFFAHPHEFRPERWTREDGSSLESEIPDFAYFPFGGGRRTCIGRRFALTELQVIVPTIARRYDFDLVGPEDLDLAPGITLHPAEDVRLRPRER